MLHGRGIATLCLLCDEHTIGVADTVAALKSNGAVEQQQAPTSKAGGTRALTVSVEADGYRVDEEAHLSYLRDNLIVPCPSVRRAPNGRKATVSEVLIRHPVKEAAESEHQSASAMNSRRGLTAPLSIVGESEQFAPTEGSDARPANSDEAEVKESPVTQQPQQDGRTLPVEGEEDPTTRRTQPPFHLGDLTNLGAVPPVQPPITALEEDPVKAAFDDADGDLLPHIEDQYVVDSLLVADVRGDGADGNEHTQCSTSRREGSALAPEFASMGQLSALYDATFRPLVSRVFGGHRAAIFILTDDAEKPTATGTARSSSKTSSRTGVMTPRTAASTVEDTLAGLSMRAVEHLLLENSSPQDEETTMQHFFHKLNFGEHYVEEASTEQRAPGSPRSSTNEATAEPFLEYDVRKQERETRRCSAEERHFRAVFAPKTSEAGAPEAEPEAHAAVFCRTSSTMTEPALAPNITYSLASLATRSDVCFSVVEFDEMDRCWCLLAEAEEVRRRRRVLKRRLRGLIRGRQVVLEGAMYGLAPVVGTDASEPALERYPLTGPIDVSSIIKEIRDLHQAWIDSPRFPCEVRSLPDGSPVAHGALRKSVTSSLQVRRLLQRTVGRDQWLERTRRYLGWLRSALNMTPETTVLVDKLLEDEEAAVQALRSRGMGGVHPAQTVVTIEVSTQRWHVRKQHQSAVHRGTGSEQVTPRTVTQPASVGSPNSRGVNVSVSGQSSMRPDLPLCPHKSKPPSAPETEQSFISVAHGRLQVVKMAIVRDIVASVKNELRQSSAAHPGAARLGASPHSDDDEELTDEVAKLILHVEDEPRDDGLPPSLLRRLLRSSVTDTVPLVTPPVLSFVKIAEIMARRQSPGTMSVNGGPPAAPYDFNTSKAISIRDRLRALTTTTDSNGNIQLVPPFWESAFCYYLSDAMSDGLLHFLTVLRAEDSAAVRLAHKEHLRRAHSTSAGTLELQASMIPALHSYAFRQFLIELATSFRNVEVSSLPQRRLFALPASVTAEAWERIGAAQPMRPMDPMEMFEGEGNDDLKAWLSTYASGDKHAGGDGTALTGATSAVDREPRGDKQRLSMVSGESPGTTLLSGDESPESKDADEKCALLLLRRAHASIMRHRNRGQSIKSPRGALLADHPSLLFDDATPRSVSAPAVPPAAGHQDLIKVYVDSLKGIHRLMSTGGSPGSPARRSLSLPLAPTSARRRISTSPFQSTYHTPRGGNSSSPLALIVNTPDPGDSLHLPSKVKKASAGILSAKPVAPLPAPITRRPLPSTVRSSRPPSVQPVSTRTGRLASPLNKLTGHLTNAPTSASPTRQATTAVGANITPQHRLFPYARNTSHRSQTPDQDAVRAQSPYQQLGNSDFAGLPPKKATRASGGRTAYSRQASLNARPPGDTSITGPRSSSRGPPVDDGHSKPVRYSRTASGGAAGVLASRAGASDPRALAARSRTDARGSGPAVRGGDWTPNDYDTKEYEKFKMAIRKGGGPVTPKPVIQGAQKHLATFKPGGPRHYSATCTPHLYCDDLTHALGRHEYYKRIERSQQGSDRKAVAVCKKPTTKRITTAAQDQVSQSNDRLDVSSETDEENTCMPNRQLDGAQEAVASSNGTCGSPGSELRPSTVYDASPHAARFGDEADEQDAAGENESSAGEGRGRVSTAMTDAVLSEFTEAPGDVNDRNSAYVMQKVLQPMLPAAGIIGPSGPPGHTKLTLQQRDEAMVALKEQYEASRQARQSQVTPGRNSSRRATPVNGELSGRRRDGTPQVQSAWRHDPQHGLNSSQRDGPKERLFYGTSSPMRGRTTVATGSGYGYRPAEYHSGPDSSVNRPGAATPTDRRPPPNPMASSGRRLPGLSLGTPRGLSSRQASPHASQVEKSLLGNSGAIVLRSASIPAASPEATETDGTMAVGELLRERALLTRTVAVDAVVLETLHEDNQRLQRLLSEQAERQGVVERRLRREVAALSVDRVEQSIDL